MTSSCFACSDDGCVAAIESSADLTACSDVSILVVSVSPSSTFVLFGERPRDSASSSRGRTLGEEDMAGVKRAWAPVEIPSSDHDSRLDHLRSDLDELGCSHHGTVAACTRAKFLVRFSKVRSSRTNTHSIDRVCISQSMLGSRI